MRIDTIILVVVVAAQMAVSGAVLDDAKALYSEGKYSEALPLMQEQYKKNPKNASLNHWLGVCLYQTGSKAESKKYFTFANGRKVLESSLYLSYHAFNEYDFEDAADYLDTYTAGMAKAKKALSEEVEAYEQNVSAARSMLEHVEKIVVVDSLCVDKAEFFKAYKISDAAGTLASDDVLPYDRPEEPQMVYIPESGDRMMWAMPDSAGVLHITQTIKLIDGSWEKYDTQSDILHGRGDACFPYMLNDGSTLYYASNGKGSIGGYDIFRTRREADSGEYLQPQNMGMPYNSPFDDYLLVVDEFTGVGWWATDRNQIPGMVTIYVFVPKEMRENYEFEDPNLKSFARLSNYKATWAEGTDCNEYLNRIAEIKREPKKKAAEFHFALTKGKEYTRMSDVQTDEGRELLEEYMYMMAQQESTQSRLKELRKQWNKDGESESLRSEIIHAEKSVLDYAQQIEELANKVRKAEGVK